MTREENIRAILECNFSGTKEELIDIAVKNIMALSQEMCESIHGSTYGGVSWGGTYKPQEPCDDAISRILKRMWNCRGKHTTSIDKVAMEQIIRDELPSVTQKGDIREYMTE